MKAHNRFARQNAGGSRVNLGNAGLAAPRRFTRCRVASARNALDKNLCIGTRAPNT